MLGLLSLSRSRTVVGVCQKLAYVSSATALSRLPGNVALHRSQGRAFSFLLRKASVGGFAASSAVPASTVQATTVPAAVAQEYSYDEDFGVGEVEWNSQLVNAVSLVGRLGRPLEIRNAGSHSQRVASSALAVSNGRDKPTSWFEIELWGPLAEAAASELGKGEQVQVLGRLKSNEYTNREGIKVKNLVVTVNSINRVRPYSEGQTATASTPNWDTQQAPEGSHVDDQTSGIPGWGNEAPTQQQQPRKNGKEQQWDHLLKHFDEYYDNRFNKRSEKAPDFKHKQTGEALWLNSAPVWVKDQLSNANSPVAPL